MHTREECVITFAAGQSIGWPLRADLIYCTGLGWSFPLFLLITSWHWLRDGQFIAQLEALSLLRYSHLYTLHLSMKCLSSFIRLKMSPWEMARFWHWATVLVIICCFSSFIFCKNGFYPDWVAYVHRSVHPLNGKIYSILLKKNCTYP